MQISNIGGVNKSQITKNINKFDKISNQEQDSFVKKEFCLDYAMETLKNSIYINDKNKESSKFGKRDLSKLNEILTETPEKWDSIKAMAETPFLKAKTVIDLASKRTEVLKAVVPYAIEPSKTNKNEAKFKPKEIKSFARVASFIDPKKLLEAKPLIKTQLSSKNITMIAFTPALEGKIEKVASKVLEMENSLGKDLKEVVFNGNAYDKSEFVIQATTKDNQLNTELLDKNLNRQAIENMSMYKSENQVYQIKKVNDLRTNTISKVRLTVDDDGRPNVTHEVRVIKDKAGKVLRKEYTSPSEVNGVFDIRHVDANGKGTIVSEGKIDKKTGITTVKKKMTSLDGTKTEYLYEDDPQGNRIVDYKITDKNGKVLLNNSNTFEIIDENHFVSTKNNEKYDIKIDKKNINVQDLNNKERKVTFSIRKDIKGNRKEILKSLKAMPGEELFKLAESTEKVVGDKDILGSYYNPKKKSINSGSDLFVILHELGHARDYRDVNVKNGLTYRGTIHKSITENKEVQKVYNEEREAFNKAFPDTQRDHIDYFINKATHYGGELGGLGETIAESNALLTTPKSHELLAIRSQYLQQYFPKTIAMLDTVLNQTKS